VRFVTARELLSLYGDPLPPRGPAADRARYAAHLAGKQTFLETEQGSLSAADLLLALLGMEPEVVDGPSTRMAGTFHGDRISRAAFERAKADAIGFIRANRRLPAEIWIADESLSIGDFAATVAADDGALADVAIHRANLEFEKYISTDPKGSFSWPIHPAGFSAPELLELGRLQAWTMKPARLR
jgi:hypothetical protein